MCSFFAFAMIGISTHGDAELTTRTEVLRASSDELALRAEEQARDIARLRGVLEELRADHGAHTLRTIARIDEIDAELRRVADSCVAADRQTTETRRQTESIRRELVQTAAKLAREFIMLPPAVSRYPRLDRAAALAAANATSPAAAAAASAARSQWYTDDQPAVNLQMVDLGVAASIAALDGRVPDADFRAELEAARTNPDSVFSKESLIRAVAASSPAKRRRGSLLMLLQASKELAKQSATIDDLTRGPNRWTDVERLQAQRAVETHDGMIREAVRELCKEAPVPRQAERQLLTALDMHLMPTAQRGMHDPDTSAASNAAGGDASDLENDDSAAKQARARHESPPQSPADPHLSGGGSRGRQQAHAFGSPGGGGGGSRRRLAPQQPGFITVPLTQVVEGAKSLASGDRGTGRDPQLRQLQTELLAEQNAMSLRSHAARVRAWQEIDLQRAARDRMEADPFAVPSRATTNAAVTHSVGFRTSPTPLSSHAPSAEGSFHVSAGRDGATGAGAASSSPTPATVFAAVMRMSAAMNGSPVPGGLATHTASTETGPSGSATRRSSPLTPAAFDSGLALPARRLDALESDPTAAAAVLSATPATPPLASQRRSPRSRPAEATAVAEALVDAPPVHPTTGLVMRPSRMRVVAVPSLVASASERSPLRPLSPLSSRVTAAVCSSRPASGARAPVQAGVADPATAAAAVSMRRTGALDAQLSFHSQRLDAAAMRVGVPRPPSASRFAWKLKPQEPHEIVVAARAAAAAAAVSGADPQALD